MSVADGNYLYGALSINVCGWYFPSLGTPLLLSSFDFQIMGILVSGAVIDGRDVTPVLRVMTDTIGARSCYHERRIMNYRMLVGSDDERDFCRRTYDGGDDVCLDCCSRSFGAYVTCNVHKAEVETVFHCICGYTVVGHKAHVGMGIKMKMRRMPGHVAKPVCKRALS